MQEQKNRLQVKENFFKDILARYLPFWPLFLGLLLTFLVITWVYLKMATPIYQASATLIIKDENKGVDDAKLTESINPFDSKKIVENEIEVIKSRTLVSKVVSNLSLYAPVYEERLLKTISAYSTSPIKVVIKNPGKIPLPSADEPKKYYFEYNNRRKEVVIEGKRYPIEEWMKVDNIGETKFMLNPYSNQVSEGSFYYHIVNPKIIANGIKGNLDIYSSNKLSTVVSLDYEDDDINKTEDVIDQLILAYGQKGVTDRSELAENTLSFIEERMLTVEKELDELEKEIQQYRSSEGVVDLSEQGKLYLQDVGEYDRQIAENTRQLAVLNRVEQYVKANRNQAGSLPSTTGIADPVLAQLLEKLYTSEIEYEKLRKTTGENNPILLSVANEIKQLRPRVRENIRNQKNNLTASLGNLSASADRSNSALNTIPAKERALLEITRRKAVKNDLFSLLQQKREETALSYAPNGGDGRVVDMAEASMEPVSPKPLATYLIAMILAFGFGIGYIWLKELLNNKVMFRSEIEEYTDIPIIGEIQFLDDTNDTSIKENQEMALLSQFRHVGSNLNLYSRDFKKKRLLITSSIPGEGKSFVCKNLAYSLAKSGRSVVLVDMDFIKPFTSQHFQINKNLGVLDFLVGKAKLVDIVTKAEDNTNLALVSSGTHQINLGINNTRESDYTSLLMNGALGGLFDELSKLFDYIVVDSAPIDLVADVSLLSEFCDQTILVVRHDHTPRRVLKNLVIKHNSKSSENMAIIFNGVKNRGILKGNYGYGYGYGFEQNYGVQQYSIEQK